jgi:fatty acid desaturase
MPAHTGAISAQIPVADWYRSLAAYEQPDLRRAGWQLLNTRVPYAALWVVFEDGRCSHSRHHANAGDLDRRGEGDIWTLTVAEYQTAPWQTRLAYRVEIVTQREGRILKQIYAGDPDPFTLLDPHSHP